MANLNKNVIVLLSLKKECKSCPFLPQVNGRKIAVLLPGKNKKEQYID